MTQSLELEIERAWHKLGRSTRRRLCLFLTEHGNIVSRDGALWGDGKLHEIGVYDGSVTLHDFRCDVFYVFDTEIGHART